MKYQHQVLGLLSLLSIITYIDRVCIGVAGPRMQDSLQISPQAWGWVASVFFLSYSAFEIPSGALGDRIGPRRVLTRIVLWWSAFTSLTGAVSNYVLLLVVRFCFGMGEAGAYPNAAAVIGRWIPARNRTRAWGIVWMTGQIGAAASPLLVLPIQARYGWRASFFVFGILGVIWAAVWYSWFRDSPSEKAGVTPEERHDIGPPVPLRHGGFPWRRALVQPTFWKFAIVGACYVYSLGFYQAWLQIYLVRGHGYTEAALALSSLTYLTGACANGVGGLVGDWMIRRFGLRRGRRTVGVIGLGVAAIFMSATTLTTSGGWALTFLTLAYAGILFQQPNLCAVSLDIGREHAGTVFGFMNTASNAASALSSVVFGYIVSLTGSYNAPLVPMAAVLVIGGCLWLTLDPTRQLFEEPNGPGASGASGASGATGAFRAAERHLNCLAHPHGRTKSRRIGLLATSHRIPRSRQRSSCQARLQATIQILRSAARCS